MQLGLIVNVGDERYDREEERTQEPCFYTEDGTPVFEVWFWHADIRRWFVMTTEPTALLEAQGAVCFRPADVPDRLRERVEALETAAAPAC